MNDKKILIGKIIGLHGIKGWLKIISFSSPPENIFKYSSIILTNNNIEDVFHIENTRKQGKKILIKLKGIDDRTLAEKYKESTIEINRSDLPDLSEGIYYWEDLIGCEVLNESKKKIGLVDSFLETGSNDVLIIETNSKKKVLIPFIINESIKEVNLDDKLIIVEWNE